MKQTALAALILVTTPAIAFAQPITDTRFAAMASDRSAQRVGDILTVVVYQSAEARNAAQNTAQRDQTLEGAVTTGSVAESVSFGLNGGYGGRGEIRRSESLITQISVAIEQVLDNGDFIVAGTQHMRVNGEETIVRVRGRVRPADITSENQVLSSRIAEAQIDYQGSGFVTRNARPGVINLIFGFLGLGG